MGSKSHRFNVSVLQRFKDEDIEMMLRRFKRKMKRSGLILEMRKKEFFVRPGELRRQKKRRRKTSDGETIDKD